MKKVYGAICRNQRIRLNATMPNDQFEVEKILFSAFARAHSEIQGHGQKIGNSENIIIQWKISLCFGGTYPPDIDFSGG